MSTMSECDRVMMKKKEQHIASVRYLIYSVLIWKKIYSRKENADSKNTINKSFVMVIICQTLSLGVNLGHNNVESHSESAYTANGKAKCHIIMLNYSSVRR